MLKSQTPYQRKLNYSVNYIKIEMSECKDHVKYLGVLLDSNLSWKSRIDNVALKVSRTVGVVARLRLFVPRTTLLNIIIFYFILLFCHTE